MGCRSGMRARVMCVKGFSSMRLQRRAVVNAAFRVRSSAFTLTGALCFRRSALYASACFVGIAASETFPVISSSHGKKRPYMAAVVLEKLLSAYGRNSAMNSESVLRLGFAVGNLSKLRISASASRFREKPVDFHLRFPLSSSRT
jgi:hypothetical protein